MHPQSSLVHSDLCGYVQRHQEPQFRTHRQAGSGAATLWRSFEKQKTIGGYQQDHPSWTLVVSDRTFEDLAAVDGGRGNFRLDQRRRSTQKETYAYIPEPFLDQSPHTHSSAAYLWTRMISNLNEHVERPEDKQEVLDGGESMGCHGLPWITCTNLGLGSRPVCICSWDKFSPLSAWHEWRKREFALLASSCLQGMGMKSKVLCLPLTLVFSVYSFNTVVFVFRRAKLLRDHPLSFPYV